jgi:hypothetical protein
MKSFLGFANVLTIVLTHPSASAAEADSGDSDSESEDSMESSELDGRTIEFAVIQGCDAVEKTKKLIEIAKAREAIAKIPVVSRAVVDFGSLSFVEQTNICPKDLHDGTKAAIIHALSFGKDWNTWCRSSIAC